MKKLTVFAALLTTLVLPGIGLTKSVGGVALQDSLPAKGISMALSGAGIRSKYFIKLYVGSLYSAASPISADAVLNGDRPSAIRLNIISNKITSDKMIETIEEGFRKSAGADLQKLRPEIDDFMALFKGKIVEGDQFTMVSLPGVGVEAYKNNQLLNTIEGDDFRKALFGIWLGGDPADAKLKSAMLGQ